MPFGDQFLGLVIAGLCCVQQFIGGIAIHHDLTGDVAHIELLRLFEKGINRDGIDGTEYGRSCGAAAEPFSQEDLCHFAGVVFILEILFRDKCVLVEPVD